MKTLFAILRLVRFPLIFTAIADASVVVVLRAQGMEWPALGAVSAAAAGLYVFGMAANDLFDVSRDRKARAAGGGGRVNPVASGELPVATAGGVAAAGLGGATAAAMLSSAIDPVVTAAAACMILLYSAGLKRFPPAGLLLLGAIRAANASQGLVGDAAVLWWAVPAVIGGHVLFVSAFAYAWEGKKPPLYGNNWYILLALSAASVLALGTVANRLGVQFWPGVGLHKIGLAWGLFLLGFLLIFSRAPRRQRGPLLILGGLTWLIVLDYTFILAAELTEPGWLYAALLAGVLVSTKVMQWLGRRVRRNG